MPNVSRLMALRSIKQARKAGDNRRYIAHDARSSFRTRSLLPEREQPTVTSEDESRTLRTRQHGNTRLPLPPLMDPLAVQVKERHKKPKALRQSGELTDFQKELRQNPYARALASPVRHCQFTTARLPVDLLQRFTATFTSTQAGNGRLEASIVPQSYKSTTQPETKYAPSAAYVINNREALKLLNIKRQWTQLVSGRMREAFDTMAVGKKAVSMNKWAKEWERDPKMPDTVLENLRWNVLDALRNVVLKDEDIKCVIPTERLQELSSFVARGTGATYSDGKDRSEQLDPTTCVRIPTYRLDQLIGEDWAALAQSKQAETAMESGHVGIMLHPSTTKLHMALRRLCAYYGDVRSETLISVSHEILERLGLESQQSPTTIGS